MAKKEFKVVMEIQIEAKNPLEAAKQVENWIKREGEHFQYYVQEDGKEEIFSVDLEETDEDALSFVLPSDYIPIITR